MKTYASIWDLTEHEIRPAILTDNTLTPEQATAVAAEVCTRLQAAGLVVWDDGWSDARQAYWLPAQGFRMADDDSGDGGETFATFWEIVAEVIEGLD